MVKRKRKIPKAIFYTNPKTGIRKRWKSGPPPRDKDGNLLRLFDSRGRKIVKPRARDKREVKLNIKRLPSADTDSALNRSKIVQFAKAKTWDLFWLRAAVFKPGEKDIIWLGTKVFLKPITTRIANAMLRDIKRRAEKSGESILAIDLIRRPKFKRRTKKKKRK